MNPGDLGLIHKTILKLMGLSLEVSLQGNNSPFTSLTLELLTPCCRAKYKQEGGRYLCSDCSSIHPMKVALTHKIIRGNMAALDVTVDKTLSWLTSPHALENRIAIQELKGEIHDWAQSLPSHNLTLNLSLDYHYHKFDSDNSFLKETMNIW